VSTPNLNQTIFNNIEERIAHGVVVLKCNQRVMAMVFEKNNYGFGV
jgi:hypothetical protein